MDWIQLPFPVACWMEDFRILARPLFVSFTLSQVNGVIWAARCASQCLSAHIYVRQQNMDCKESVEHINAREMKQMTRGPMEYKSIWLCWFCMPYLCDDSFVIVIQWQRPRKWNDLGKYCAPVHRTAKGRRPEAANNNNNHHLDAYSFETFWHWFLFHALYQTTLRFNRLSCSTHPTEVPLNYGFSWNIFTQFHYRKSEQRLHFDTSSRKKPPTISTMIIRVDCSVWRVEVYPQWNALRHSMVPIMQLFETSVNRSMKMVAHLFAADHKYFNHSNLFLSVWW